VCNDDRAAQCKALLYGMPLVDSKIIRIARFLNRFDLAYFLYFQKKLTVYLEK